MSVTINRLMVDEVTVQRVEPDKFGKLVVSSSKKTNARFRQIDRIVQSGAMENLTNQSIIWLPSDTIVSIGDTILTADGDRYRITDLVKAKRGGETQISFLKCFVERVK